MTLSRRTAIQSLALGAGGLLFPTARSACAARRRDQPARFLFVPQSNGFHPWAAQPQGLERREQGPDRPFVESLREFEFTEDLSPLKPLKNRTTILQRLNGAHTWPWHSAFSSALSGIARKTLRPTASPTDATIDAALAQALPAKVPIVHLGIENSDNNDDKRRERFDRKGDATEKGTFYFLASASRAGAGRDP